MKLWCFTSNLLPTIATKSCTSPQRLFLCIGSDLHSLKSERNARNTDIMKQTVIITNIEYIKMQMCNEGIWLMLSTPIVLFNSDRRGFNNVSLWSMHSCTRIYRGCLLILLINVNLWGPNTAVAQHDRFRFYLYLTLRISYRLFFTKSQRSSKKMQATKAHCRQNRR